MELETGDGVTGSRELYDAASALTPERIISYIRTQGWLQDGSLPRLSLWKLAIGADQYKIALPTEPELRDYRYRVADLVEVIAASQGRAAFDVLVDLSTRDLDVQHIRLLTATPSGTAPLAAAARAYSAARDMLLAAAVTVVSETRDLVHPARKPPGAKALVGRSLVGPSGAGSYVLSVQVPVLRATPQSTRAGANAVPSGRSVSQLLYRAIRTIHDEVVATEGNLVQPLALRVDDGVSANLCAALAGFGGDANGEHGFEIRFAWAAGDSFEEPTEPVKFSPRDAARLREAAEALRKYGLQTGVTIRGRITNMDRAPTRGPGIVTVEGVLENAPDAAFQHYRVELPEESYLRAGVAHTGGLQVTIHGDLFRSGTRLHVRNVDTFVVAES